MTAQMYPYYLCHMVHQWLEFRLAELRACAEAVDVPLEIAAADEAAFLVRREIEP